ncbi:histidinol-phosphate transaminase [Thalassoroseus pseudoceratinae]|uniref:histidinol-phosphate transaminase n=1 Tax=Thalassoroseus pseudoceratinae TaxID=2713176 RepID=UPI00142008F1|nr:histidinol-phosphate transaminase [Thalassoroseus pseudoceratinae]
MSLFREAIDRIEGYVPGEQPQDSGWVKLNTNENPYPPSPRVVDAIKRAAEGRLNLYPDPLSKRFREVAAPLFGVDPDWILPANGSDENLTILVRSFADPGQTIRSPYPSYILYETLAGIQDARHERLSLEPDWSFSESAFSQAAESRLVFVPNPNSPSGNRWSDETILKLIPENGIFVLDEAYGDFCESPHHAELIRNTNSTRESAGRIVITRTLSKSYSLAGLRFGFAIARPELIAGMRKVKDSYNCNTLGLAAATAALEDQEWMQANVKKVQATRKRLSEALVKFGFDVVPSETNFVWATHPSRSHAEIFESLKARKILLRFMKFPNAFGESADETAGTFDGLRITVGTDAEIDRLISELETILA